MIVKVETTSPYKENSVKWNIKVSKYMKMSVFIDWSPKLYDELCSEFNLETDKNLNKNIDYHLESTYGIGSYVYKSGKNPILDIDKFTVFQLVYGNYIVSVHNQED